MFDIQPFIISDVSVEKFKELKKIRFRQKNFFLKKLGFTPCKAEQPIQGIELQEKEANKG